MLFYPSMNHSRLNGRPWRPDLWVGRAMTNPHYPVREVTGEELMDSGAFQVRDLAQRETPNFALDRQIKAARGRRPRLVHYDCLLGVDEALEGGRRVKRRGSEESAAEAVRLTIEGAEAYARRALEVEGGFAYSAQGATIPQYLRCADALLEILDPSRDWLALGGFCIIGRNTTLIPQFLQTLAEVAPRAKRRGVQRLHLLGVTTVRALPQAAAIARREGLEISTDSSSIEVNSVMGKVFEGGWRKVYGPADKPRGPDILPGQYHPAELGEANVRRFTAWVESI